MNPNHEVARVPLILGIFFGTITLVAAILFDFYYPKAQLEYYQGLSSQQTMLFVTLLCIALLNYTVALGAALYRFKLKMKK